MSTFQTFVNLQKREKKRKKRKKDKKTSLTRDSSYYFYLVRPRPNLEVQCEGADCGASPGHPREREGIQLRDTYPVEWMSPGSRIWAGAAFSNPRTPEKAQRRLGGL